MLFHNRNVPLPRNTEAAKRRGIVAIDAQATNRSTRSWRGVNDDPIDENHPASLEDLVQRLVHHRKHISRDHHFRVSSRHHWRGTLRHFGDKAAVSPQSILDLLAHHTFIAIDQGLYLSTFCWFCLFFLKKN